MSQPWIIMPFIDLWEPMTRLAALDCLGQQGLASPARLLLINNGSCDADRDLAEGFVEANLDRVLMWSHEPPLPSLSATWNRALDFCWAVGAEEALVVNNDVKLHRETYETLRDILRVHEAFFVSGVGVKEDQFDPDSRPWDWLPGPPEGENIAGLTGIDVCSMGGPDFSCFLISKACHTKYRFDENFIPAYHEDGDYHRRLMLGGDGSRIFGVNVPYLHYGSATINRTPETSAAFHAEFRKSQAYYMRKWGGLPPRDELWLTPFKNGAPDEGCVSNAAMQKCGCTGGRHA